MFPWVDSRSGAARQRLRKDGSEATETNALLKFDNSFWKNESETSSMLGSSYDDGDSRIGRDWKSWPLPWHATCISAHEAHMTSFCGLSGQGGETAPLVAQTIHNNKMNDDAWQDGFQGAGVYFCQWRPE